MFNFQSIQTGRMLTEPELFAVNYIIKSRAYRYIASTDRDWLFPERSLKSTHWSKFAKEWLLMPDPRGVSFGREIIIGYEGGRSSMFDEYGRRPWENEFKDKRRSRKEWDTFQRFQGEFASCFGPKRRGRSFEWGRPDKEEDDPEFHSYHLSLARKSKLQG
jgi:hypothetical protein